MCSIVDVPHSTGQTFNGFMCSVVWELVTFTTFVYVKSASSWGDPVCILYDWWYGTSLCYNNEAIKKEWLYVPCILPWQFVWGYDYNRHCKMIYPTHRIVILYHCGEDVLYCIFIPYLLMRLTLFRFQTKTTQGKPSFYRLQNDKQTYQVNCPK